MRMHQLSVFEVDAGNDEMLFSPFCKCTSITSRKNVSFTSVALTLLRSNRYLPLGAGEMGLMEAFGVNQAEYFTLQRLTRTIPFEM